MTTLVSNAVEGMSLDELAEAQPIRATEPMPPEIQRMLRPRSGVYVRSKSTPTFAFEAKKISGTNDIWEAVDRLDSEDLLTAIPGESRTEVQIEGSTTHVDGTDGHRPPWLDMEFLPRLVPFRTPDLGAQLFMEPRAQEAERLTYPWCTNGKVFTNGRPAGSGVLVGPNLMLTAGHVAPWDTNPWSMEFVPGLRITDRPFGSSFVSQFRGYRVGSSPTGYDYVICRLYTPLGNALGWMGSVAFGAESEYYRRRYISTGYPSSFGLRPAVEFDMGVRDIDNDDPGLELEFPLRPNSLGPGWSGGPLWLPNEGPRVAGTVSGQEKDGLDPTRYVISAGFGMTRLVRFGLDNWRP